jgi:hypothetical protein
LRGKVLTAWRTRFKIPRPAWSNDYDFRDEVLQIPAMIIVHFALLTLAKIKQGLAMPVFPPHIPHEDFIQIWGFYCG